MQSSVPLGDANDAICAHIPALRLADLQRFARAEERRQEGSQTNATRNLGGLAAADPRCQTLAPAVGVGPRTCLD